MLKHLSPFPYRTIRPFFLAGSAQAGWHICAITACLPPGTRVAKVRSHGDRPGGGASWRARTRLTRGKRVYWLHVADAVSDAQASIHAMEGKVHGRMLAHPRDDFL